MAKNSQIEWTHHTFNPWWGCAKVSPACDNCYAELWAKRMGHRLWGAKSQRRFFGDAHWREPLVWNEDARAEKKRARVFCASMADVFEKRSDLELERSRLWKLVAATPELDWLLLTKRPQNIGAMVPWSPEDWPRNVWLGTTVENQNFAAQRLPHLLKHKAAVRFLSCEPLLGPIDLSPWISVNGLQKIDWIIPTIQKIIREAGSSAFRFVFLDPKGWSDIPMAEIRPLLNVRGSEVVVNLMTRFMIRFLEQPDRAESFRGLFGRDEVLPILDATPSSEKHDALVREYGKSLHQLCNFKYVSSAIILEPKRDDIRYFLVYGTNHHRGVEVFKAAETKAARLQDHIRHEAAVHKSGGQDNMLGALFGSEAPKSDYAYTLWQRYCEKAKRKVISRILAAPATGVAFGDLFCDAMAFPLVTPADLNGWLTQWRSAVELRLEGERRKKISPDHNDFVIATDTDQLRSFLKD
jgi:protein gp37